MMIARWNVDARFGCKQAALALMQRWWKEIAPQIGWSKGQVRILSGSLGAPESTIQVEIEIADLAALNDAWTRLAQVPEQEAWATELQPLIVSGSTCWSVYRRIQPD